MASTHSLNTPSRSTMRSCVNSRPSTWTFQYIHLVGRMTTFCRAAASDLRIVSASLSEINFASSSFFSFGSTGRRINRGQVIAHFLPHEHAVRADVNDAFLPEQAVHQLFDLRINQRFAAANRDHRRVAFHRHGQAFFQRHHVLEVGGIFADAAAAGAGEIAGVQRFELQDHGKLGRFAQFVLDDVTGDFRRQGKWKSHRIIGLGRVGWTGRPRPPARGLPPEADRPSHPAGKTRRAKRCRRR